MTRTTNSIILFNDVWAADGETTSAPFAPRAGWDSTYSQAGGNTVSRTLVNGEFNKFAALGYDVNRYGANLFWDSTITYEIGATVLGSNNLRYIAVTQNSNNDPTVDNGTNWTPLKITFANDANVTISEDTATNTVTIGLVSNLSDKANSDLSNVTIGDFAAKIADGQYTYKQIDGSQVKINAYEILTDSNITFSSNTFNKQMTFGTSIRLSSLRNNFNSGSSPSPAVSGMLWNDTSTTTLYIRNSANDNWVTVANNDSYINSIFTGTYNINSNYNGRTYILINTGSGSNAPFTLNLPAHSSVQDDFRMDFISYGNSDITINAFGGEQFYRNQQLTSSVLLTNQENAIFSIIKFNNDDNFYLIGNEKNNFIDSNTIIWNVDSNNNVIADLQSEFIDEGSSINEGFVINDNDNGKTFLVGISNASIINKNISLPSYSTLPNGWFVNLEIDNLPINQSKALSLNIIPNGGDLIIRNNQSVNSTLQITGASSSTLKIIKHPSISGFVITGNLNFEEIQVLGNTNLTGNIITNNVFGYNIGNKISQYVWYYKSNFGNNLFVKVYSDVQYINNYMVQSGVSPVGTASSILISSNQSAGSVLLSSDNTTLINTCGDDDTCPLVLFVGKEEFI
jgi:hypothetical protein